MTARTSGWSPQSEWPKPVRMVGERVVIREKRIEDRREILLSPVHGALDPAELAKWMIEDRINARLQAQLHKYLWPGIEKGV